MSSVIVVGAGHNGLVAAAYMARAGFDVTVLEARDVVGGASATEELIPGFRSSSCAFVVGLLRPEIIRQLELVRHGLDLYQAPDVLGATIGDDGRHFLTYQALDRELVELRRHFGARDADAFLAFGASMQRVGALLQPRLLAPPDSVEAVRDAFARTGLTDLFDRFVAGSVGDLLDAYFDSAALKGYLGFPGLVSVFGGPRTPGTAYVLTHHSVNEFQGRFGQWGFARGGMGAVSQALVASATAAGARIQRTARVASIPVEDGRATGVVLEGGDELRADAVVSSADPQHTLLALVGERGLPPEVVRALRGLDLRGSMARVHIALEGLPRYAGFDGDGIGPQHIGHTLLGPTFERFERAAGAQAAGQLPDDFAIEVLMDSVREPGIAPPGQHMMITGVQQLPRELEGRTWDEAKDELARRVVAQLCRYAPGLDRQILATHVLTPLDLEREYGLTGGNIYQGAMGVDQLFDQRPIPGWSDYRTPVAGLYLCGSGTHPGGGVMGAPGHNAAHTVAADLLGATPPWARSSRAGRSRPGLEDRLAAGLVGYRMARRLAGAVARRRWLRPVIERLTRRDGV